MPYRDYDYYGFIVSVLEKNHPKPLKPIDFIHAAEECIPNGERVLQEGGKPKYISRISWTLYALKKSGDIIHDKDNHTYSLPP